MGPSAFWISSFPGVNARIWNGTYSFWVSPIEKGGWKSCLLTHKYFCLKMMHGPSAHGLLVTWLGNVAEPLSIW